jgi:biopolymer transport protein ExbB
MYPILLCSIISLAIFLERMWNLRRSKVIPKNFLIEVEDLISRGMLPEAITLCRKNRTSISNIFLEAIKNHNRERNLIKEVTEEVGRREIANLERYISALATIASVSTLLGLLGTISGMIKIFSVISIQPVVNPSSLAGGISEALYTTAFGLTIAIPTLVFHKFLSSKVDSLTIEMEENSINLIKLLTTRNSLK